jgi:hypothetical protein
MARLGPWLHVIEHQTLFLGIMKKGYFQNYFVDNFYVKLLRIVILIKIAAFSQGLGHKGSRGGFFFRTFESIRKEFEPKNIICKDEQ